MNTYTQMNLPWSFKWDGTVVGFFFVLFCFCLFFCFFNFSVKITNTIQIILEMI